MFTHLIVLFYCNEFRLILEIWLRVPKIWLRTMVLNGVAIK